MKLRSAAVAFLTVAFVVPLHADSFFPVRPEDPRAVCLTKESFGAQADGIGDDSGALQQAIDRVQETTRIGLVFVPEGRYRLGKTVFVWQGIRLIGYGRNRPILLLGKNTPGYQEGSGKHMLHFADYRPQQGRPFSDGTEFTFYSGMSNIDIEIEEGNPAAVAVRFHVAQHSYLQHMNFKIGSARAALEDIGNQASDIHVRGGKYGIITKRTAPVWQFLLMDSSFEGQSEAAIHTMEAGFTLVRVRFAHMPVAIQIASGEVEQLYARDLRMEDIRVAGLKHGNARNPHSEVTLTNISCTDVPIFYQGEKETRGSSKHYLVTRFAAGLSMDDRGREKGITVYSRQRKLSRPAPPVATDIPPLPPVTRWVNVQTLGLKGDGKTDDTAALRAAIERHPALYFPIGTYRVTASIELKPDTALIGLNPGNTVIALASATPTFSGGGEALGVLVAPSGGKNIVSSIGIVPGTDNPRAAGVVWMAGPASMLDDVSFPGGGGPKYSGTQGPDLWIRDGGGGIFRGNWPHGTIASTGLRVENTSTPGKVYQMSVEHHMRVESQFRNVAGWEFYALQTEEENPAGTEAIALEIQGCRNLLFANTYMYRVSRTVLPKTYAVIARNSDDIRFENVKVFSQTRLSFDNSVLDEDSGVAVRPHFFTTFTINKRLKQPGPAPPPPLFAKNSAPQKLAGGFSNASGMTADDAGRLYFTDASKRKIYRWNETDRKAEPIAETEGQPMVLGFAKPSTLLIVTYEKAVLILKTEPNADSPKLLAGSSEKKPGTVLLLPVGLHNMLSVLNDLMGRRDYVYRMGSNTAITSIVENAPRSYFYAPGTNTAVMAGGTWRPILQSSNLAAFLPGEERYVTSEDDGKTYRVKLQQDGTLTAAVFAERGGTSVVCDEEGNVYVAEGQVYIYDRQGNQIGVLELPERPGSLAFGGPDRQTLYIGARSSLYSIRTAAPGR